MKKKITYILSLLMIVCMLGACGSDNAEKTYGGYTTDELHTEATDSLGNIQNYIALVDNCGGYDNYEKSVKEVEEKTGMTEGDVVYNTLGQSEQAFQGKISTLSLMLFHHGLIWLTNTET